LSVFGIRPSQAGISGNHSFHTFFSDSTLDNGSRKAMIDACPQKEDFNYTIDPCSPLSVAFQTSANTYISIQWQLDDGTVITGNNNPSHAFSNAGDHTVTMITNEGTCMDTVTKIISMKVIPANIISTKDTTICFGSSFPLRTQKAVAYCWSPVKYLSNPNASSPVAAPMENITYYYTAQVQGGNLIVNGDFSQGNTGFTSEYNYASPNVTEGQYFVGNNGSAWNASMSPCSGHTSGNDNMLLVNGAPTTGVNVWKETIAVTPNTNYVFSTWIEALWPPNPAQLQFSFNGRPVGSLITASLPTCTWTQFYSTWNSGSNTTVVISIVNQNTAVQGNDFALDDISFAPVTIQRDSVVIKVDTALTRTNNDTSICPGKIIQLHTTGTGVSFSWSPSAGLSNPATANPVATPAVSTQYIVSGTSAAGCVARDTVNITIYSPPVITKTPDTTICHDKTIQLQAGGGSIYTWLPSPTLSNTNIPNPVASPLVNTVYYLTVTGSYGCTNSDSVKVNVKQLPIFGISSGISVCKGSQVQLTATGGDVYAWTPADGLNDPNIAGPVATALQTGTYTVKIIESTCKDSSSLSTSLTVLPLPQVKATSSNDVDCSMPVTQLNVSGGSYYLWQPAGSLTDSTGAVSRATPSVNTVYVVKATDLNGCVNYDSVLVLVTHSGDLLVNLPNAFTPNGDGRNDCFGISRYGYLLQHVHFSIYNRSGARLFYTTNPMNCWDGRFRGELQDSGGYVYVLQASTFCGEIFKKGIVMLIK
jgi:gliding motility-associated-like protein